MRSSLMRAEKADAQRRLWRLGAKERQTWAGGTKPSRRTRRRFKAGAKTSGGIGSRPRAGPGRASKRRPVGTKGIQLQRRMKAG